jgi:hypothetical protein
VAIRLKQVSKSGSESPLAVDSVILYTSSVLGWVHDFHASLRRS